MRKRSTLMQRFLVQRAFMRVASRELQVAITNHKMEKRLPPDDGHVPCSNQ